MPCFRVILLCLSTLSALSCGLKVLFNHTFWDKQLRHTLARVMVQRTQELSVEAPIGPGGYVVIVIR